MVDALAALLPVAGVIGWYVSHRHYKRKQNATKIDHSGYFKGLNYLLNEQPDKAIDVFVELLEVDDETIETHLALGSLFRQRGEVEKSIRLHQNLIARPQLSQQLRADVLNELGLDYMRAGLLDRAENIYLELEKHSLHKANAVCQLLSIYQQESEWSKAIKYAQTLESIERRTLPVLLSHLYCEQSEMYQKSQDTVAAMTCLKKAAKVDPACVRVNAMRAKICFDEGSYKAALKYYLDIRKQDKRFIPIYLEQVLICFDKLNKAKDKFKFLSSLEDSLESALVAKEFIDDLKEQRGGKQAIGFVQQKISENPSLTYLALYAKLALEHEQRTESDFLLEALDKIYQARMEFQCQHCGFSASKLNWGCPSCKTWGATVPIRT